MIELKSEFKSSSLKEWKDQLTKDLKGQDFDVLLRNDSIEEIEYPTFSHAESLDIQGQVPGKSPYTRGLKTASNNWNNGFSIVVNDSKVANEKALDVLMKGVDLIHFDLKNDTAFDATVLFSGIELQYIQTQITFDSIALWKELLRYFGDHIPTSVYFNFSLKTIQENTELKGEILAYLKNQQHAIFLIDGYTVQQAGGNTWQEIAYCLAKGNEAIGFLLENGLNIDEAAACVHFSLGIGSNYFFEIGKIRAFKQNWASMIKAYSPEHSCSYNTQITAHIGFLNKSLKDPHTNLLRQTTEAMSAAAGGIDAIIVHPYDANSENGSSTLAERMAINISLILKEESYFDAVIDPLGGSYAIEDLTVKIAQKSWELFQKMEKTGGIEDAETYAAFLLLIAKKAEMRLKNVNDKKTTLIGINKFPNPQTQGENAFLPREKNTEFPSLIIERDLIAEL